MGGSNFTFVSNFLRNGLYIYTFSTTRLNCGIKQDEINLTCTDNIQRMLCSLIRTPIKIEVLIVSKKDRCIPRFTIFRNSCHNHIKTFRDDFLRAFGRIHI